MALVHAGSIFLALCFFLIAEFCLGAFLLRKLQVTIERFAEFFLIAVSTGVVLTEVVIFLVQWTQHIRAGCMLIVLLTLLPIWTELPRLLAKAKHAYQMFVVFDRREELAFCAVGVVLLIEFLASLAPLTGSDALHYHFTTQKLILEQGFHPIFSLTHSFLCGQGHLLILLGLALGSEQLATGLIFLGGVLSALSVVCLAIRWVPRYLALLFVLAFLVAPLVFWQICTSGSPDIWIGVFVGAAALILSGQQQEISWRHAVLAGLLAGGAAGAKYTGCLFAATLALTVFVETRSSVKTTFLFLAALISGIWPYLRNLIWTGDPLFPFLTRVLFTQRLNAFALAQLNADTGIAFSHSVLGVFSFLFFAGQQPGNTPAFWEFYGPIVLAFLPLILLAFRNNREWRVRIIAWIASGVLIFGASGLVRFMLPLFPIALSCAAAGVFQASQRGWVQAYRLATTSLILFSFFGATGFLIYSKPALLTTLGIFSRNAYLEAKPQITRSPQRSIGLSARAPLGVRPWFSFAICIISIPHMCREIQMEAGASTPTNSKLLRTSVHSFSSKVSPTWSGPQNTLA